MSRAGRSACLLHPDLPAPDPAVLERLAQVPVACVTDANERSGVAVGLYPVSGVDDTTRVAGPALTVRTAPGDNLAVHRAADLIRPGDVLVVDAGGALDRAIAGGLLLRWAARRGAAAVVVDGAVRDLAELTELGLPVYARGVCPHGPYKQASGEIRGTVTVGGTTVRQGDLVVLDRDGLAVVPADRAEEIAQLAHEIAVREDEMVAAIDGGQWNRPWVDDLTVCTVHHPHNERTS